MQLLHGVALLRCIILDILFPSLNTFSKGDGLVGICTTGIIAIYATRINLERQELVASRNIGRSLGELLIELLTTEVFVRIAIGNQSERSCSGSHQKRECRYRQGMRRQRRES